jgi:hypothetical protein
MEDNIISRKKFLGLGAAATGAALFSGIAGNAASLPEESKEKVSGDYLLTNVRLEEGFNYNEKNEVISTKTGLYNLHIANGKIKSITLDKPALKLKNVDAKGMLCFLDYEICTFILIKHTTAEHGMLHQEKGIQ